MSTNLTFPLIRATVQNELGETLGVVNSIVVNEHGVHIIIEEYVEDEEDDPKEPDERETGQIVQFLKVVGDTE